MNAKYTKLFGWSLVLAFVLVYLLPLGVRPMFLPDEYRYGEIPREMLVHKDFLTPHLNGLKYFEKPQLGYWLTALSLSIFGENAFGVRLPSALAAGGTALILFFWMRHVTRKTMLSLFSSAIYLGCLEVFAIGNFAILDGMLTFWVSLTMYAFFRGYDEEDQQRMRNWLLLGGAGAAAAFVTKGFLGIVIPGVSLLPFIIWEGKSRRIPQYLLWSGIAFLVLVLPWAIAMQLKEPDFWRYFIMVEHVQRFMGENAQHPEPFWLFFAWMPAAIFPWSFFLPAILMGYNKADIKEKWLRFALCWGVLPFLFFSASKGKLLTYILPCFPAFAVMVAYGLNQYLESKRKKAFTVSSWLLTGLMFLLIVAVSLIQLDRIPGLHPYHSFGQWAILSAGVWLFAFLIWLSARLETTRNTLLCLAVSVLPFYLALQTALPHETIQRKAPGDFVFQQKKHIFEVPVYVADESLVQAVCWELKTNDVILLERKGEMEYGLGHSESLKRYWPLAQLRPEVENPRRGRPLWLFLKRRVYEEWVESIPQPDSMEWSEGERFVVLRYDKNFDYKHPKQ